MSTVVAEPLVDAHKLAEHLGVHHRDIARLVKAGELPAGLPVSKKRLRWRFGEVEAWLQEKAATAAVQS